MATTVLLADDHPLLRTGIRRVLESHSDVEVVAEAADGEEAERRIRETCPDLAVLDVELPIRSGIEVMRRLREADLPTRMLVLSMHSGGDIVVEALRSGARGYVLKTANPSEICVAVDAVRSGGIYLSPAIAGHFVETGEGDSGPAKSALTPRESEVLTLIAEGLSAPEIARKLGLSRKTVETHRWNLMEKLDIHKVVGLVKYAVRHRLVQI